MTLKDIELNVINDSYNLNTIYFYLAEGCNLRCRHCWIAPKYQAGSKTYPCIPFDLFQSIIEQALPLGLCSVKLTGGEPLLHPDINKILQFIRLKGINLFVETNGVLCTPEIAELMASCKSSSVSVSLDGATAETHEWVRGVKGCYNDTIQGIRNLVNAGIKPLVIMTIMEHNKDQVEDLVRLAESLGASAVKFNVVQPTERGQKMHERGEALPVEEYIRIGEWVESTLSKSTKLKLVYCHPIAFKALGRMFNRNGDGCYMCSIKGIIGVLADGSYALCGIGESIPELIFGNAARDSLEDVWKNSDVLHQIRKGLPGRLEGICSECLMKNRCLGSCIAQNYYRKKSLWAPYWYCEEAFKAGVFPESRRFQKDLLIGNNNIKIK